MPCATGLLPRNRFVSMYVTDGLTRYSSSRCRNFSRPKRSSGNVSVFKTPRSRELKQMTPTSVQVQTSCKGGRERSDCHCTTFRSLIELCRWLKEKSFQRVDTEPLRERRIKPGITVSCFEITGIGVLLGRGRFSLAVQSGWQEFDSRLRYDLCLTPRSWRLWALGVKLPFDKTDHFCCED